MDGAQSTVDIQGPWTVHEADRAIRLTHLLSCTTPVSSWHDQARPHARGLHGLRNSVSAVCEQKQKRNSVSVRFR